MNASEELDTLSVRKVGNSLGTTFPQELIKHMNVGQGDKIFAQKLPNGEVKLTPYDPHKAKVMQARREIHRQYRNAFKELADR
ncbi:AbrB/MazE/SpoVT family DNA-binding domain-containing protein [Gloeocapsa sp. BRSZ]